MACSASSTFWCCVYLQLILTFIGMVLPLLLLLLFLLSSSWSSLSLPCSFSSSFLFSTFALLFFALHSRLKKKEKKHIGDHNATAAVTIIITTTQRNKKRSSVKNEEWRTKMRCERTSRYGKSKCNSCTHSRRKKNLKKVYKNLGNHWLSNILYRTEPRCGSPMFTQ